MSSKPRQKSIVEETKKQEVEVTEAQTSLEVEEDDSGIQQFVTFRVGKEVFGVPIAEVQEIVRVPDVTRVPLSPQNLEGLANLRGATLPVISLRHIFGCPEKEHDDSTRVLVINHGQLLGFVVDEVASVLSVEEGQIEDTSAIEGSVNTDYLTGVLKNVGGHAMVMALDFKKILANEFALIADGKSKQGLASVVAAGHEQDDESADSDQLHLVSFSVEGQEYAIAIEQVQEIMQVPEDIVSVPNSESHVLGVITLRNNLLPLVSLRQMFSLTVEPLTDRNRIVVINLGQTSKGTRCSVGIVTDTVNEVLRVDRNVVDNLPRILAADGSLMEITAIGRLDGGKRLVSFLSAESMFAHKTVRTALEAVAEESDDNYDASDDAVDEVESDDEEHVVVFRLGLEEFGVPIHTVQEIVRAPETFTNVPNAPHYVAGVVNLRGGVLPVIDQRKRFGMATMERNDRQRIVVFNLTGTRTGFIVDSVSEVFKVPKDTIEPAPNLSKEQANLIRRVANLEKQKRMILLLDVDRLLDQGEWTKVASLAA